MLRTTYELAQGLRAQGKSPLADPVHIVNPYGKTHGDRSDEVRHVGDLGNITTDGQGNAKGSLEDSLVKLIGPESIIGVSTYASMSNCILDTNFI